jgi:hypothetical protein
VKQIGRQVANAIFVPSGDQAGDQFESSSGVLVRLVCVLPSAFMTKISELVPVFRVKAIFVPSGDQAG